MENFQPVQYLSMWLRGIWFIDLHVSVLKLYPYHCTRHSESFDDCFGFSTIWDMTYWRCFETLWRSILRKYIISRRDVAESSKFPDLQLGPPYLRVEPCGAISLGGRWLGESNMFKWPVRLCCVSLLSFACEGTLSRSVYEKSFWLNRRNEK